MKKRQILIAGCMAAIGVVSVACKKNADPTPTMSTPTLYERVGGTTMVADPKGSAQIEKGRLTLRSVVDSSILVVAADPNMAKYFPVLFAELGAGKTSGLTALSENFTDFMCVATGSKNSAYAYMGLSMKDAHDPAKNNRMTGKVDAMDFDRFVGDIGIGLAQNGVTTANNKELVTDLVALLNTTKGDIVQK